MTDIRTCLIQCFRAVFPNLSEEEIVNAHFISVTEWDSIAAINLVTVIEEEFDLQVSPESMENMVSFETILEYLRSHKEF